MDWNSVLLWMPAVSCLFTINASLRASPKLKGWIVVCLLILIAGITAYLLEPDVAGYVAGGLWGVFVLSPALLQRASLRWSVRQKYAQAARYAALAGYLHPFDGVPEQSRVLHAMAMAEAGNRDSALSILQGLENDSPTRIARLAAVHSRRLADDWPGVISWIHANVPATRLMQDASLLPMYVRALGETGQLGEMLRVVFQSRVSHHPQMAVIRNTCRMIAFAFCGQPQQVENACSGVLVNMPINTRWYWIATAMYAAGLLEDATAQLNAILPAATPELKIAIERRLARPPVVASVVLNADDLSLLEQLDLQQDHERRFTLVADPGRRPWVTYGLTLANVAVFAAEWAMGAGRGHWVEGGSTTDMVLDRLGAMEPDVLQTHEYYRLLMGNFLHFGYPHLIMNMLALLILGPFVEFTLGWVSYLCFYLLSCLCVMTTVLFLMEKQLMEPDMLVGASGAIMAIIGATACILLRGWYRDHARAAGRRLVQIGFLLALQVTFDHFTPQVSGTAHIVGMIWGFVLATLLPHRKPGGVSQGFQVRLVNQ